VFARMTHRDGKEKSAMHILIVDDSTVMAKILELILLRQGFEVTVAHSGAEALKHLRERADIGLVIADVMMPMMDGLELLRRLRAMPECATLPVILCTALSDAGTVREAVRLGCRHYLVKPIEPSALLARVRDALAGEPVVLSDPTETQQRLGLSEANLSEVITEYMRLLESELSYLRAPADRQEDVTRRAANLQWRQIEEGAELLGANRLLHLLRGDLASPTDRTRLLPAQISRLLRELETLRLALRKICAHQGDESLDHDGASIASGSAGKIDPHHPPISPVQPHEEHGHNGHRGNHLNGRKPG
jgi:two-component system chemotaxis response regulator CheY